MTRKASKSIDQIEKDDSFIFRERNADQPDRRKESKEFVIVRDHTGLCFIKYTAGGEVPAVLKGRWTSMQRAQEAIQNYVTTREQKEQGGVEQQ